MPPKKELSKHQLSHRLQFQSHTPNFLRAFQAQVSGFPKGGGAGEDDEDGPQYANGDEFHQGKDEFGRDIHRGAGKPAVDEFGREIRRETSEELATKGTSGRGKGRGKDADEEDEEDEMPQVVVLKEGKHLSAREAENERRRVRGLSPLPDLERDDGPSGEGGEEHPASRSTQQTPSKSLIDQATNLGKTQSKPPKSAVQLGAKAGGGAKRKVPLGGRDDEQNEEGSVPANKRLKGGEDGVQKKKEKKEKGKKKAVKGLLSFGDDG